MRRQSKVLFAVAVLLAFLALAPAAQAAPKDVVETIGQAGTGAGEFAFPTGVAINQATGDIYVADVDCCGFSTGGQRVLQFTASGDFVRAWGWGVATGANAFEVCTTSCQAGIQGSGDGQFSLGLEPTSPQVAVDQSDGSVYVVDNLNDRIQKFTSTGAYLGKFGTTGSDDGQFSFPSGVAVDPVSGDVYVADSNNGRVQRFDDTGVFQSQVGAPGSGDGELSNPTRVAVDSTGRLYVLDQGNGRVQRFTAAGTFDQVFAPGLVTSPTDLTVDPADNHVYVAGQSSDATVQGIFEFDSSGTEIDIHAANTGIPLFPGGMAVRSSTGRIYASSPLEPKSVMVLDEGVNAPSATIDPVTVFDADSATLSGEVNPNGIVSANWRFQISTDGTTWNDVGTGGTVPEGTTAQQVTDEVTGLEPNTTYQVHLVATKRFFSGQGVDATLFTTEAVGPVVTALDPGPVTATSAWLGAYVDPRNAATTFYVEYSTDPGFASSSSVPASEDASAGSGGTPVLANRLVGDLQPSTTYHYRVIAANVAGTTTGESRSFTTEAVPSGPPAHGLPDGRVWEKVSPAFKNGANIQGGNKWNGAGIVGERSQAAVDGSAVAFGSKGKFAGGEAGPATSQYVSRRGPGGWSTEPVNPPMDPRTVGGMPSVSNMNVFQWFSDDLSHGLVTTAASLNPGDPKDAYNLYLRNNLTRSHVTISNGGESTVPATFYYLQGVSPDGEHIVFKEVFEATHGPLMERTLDGALKEVSVLPDESVVPAYVGGGERGYEPGLNPISTDGSRIFFSTAIGGGDVYVRENGTQETTLISASEDEPGVPRGGDFQAASTDGTVAFFRSSAPLTGDSHAVPGTESCTNGESEGGTGICELYRWDSTAQVGERLTNLTTGDPQGAHALGVVGLGDAGDTAYFVATGNLDGNGSRTRPNLYVWREGEGARFIAHLNAGVSETDWGLWSRGIVDIQLGDVGNDEQYRPARVSADGRYLLFSTHVPQTAYDTNGKQAIYLYDSETDRISCISCGTVEPKSKGDSWFVSCLGEDDSETNCDPAGYLSRNLRADGKRFFFDSADNLVPQDTNGVTDVYEWQAGELHLISSGTSAFPSRFVDASASGDDAFFTTAQRLTASDQDELRDLYDARVGGTPEPSATPPCVGEECQGTPKPPPGAPLPSSMGYQGPGDISQARRRCRAGKVRRKGRCVARKARKAGKRQSKNRRADNHRRAGR